MNFRKKSSFKIWQNGLFWRRVTATVVIIAFSLFDAARYAPQGYASPSAVTVASGPALLSIPKELGKIDEAYFPTNDGGRMTEEAKTVIFIQDAHDSLEAQENIARIIGLLVKEKGIRTVFEEGYEGPVPTDKFFGFIKDPSIKQKVSYFLLDKLRIGGAEYAHINRTGAFDLIGVEDLKLYGENLLSYRNASKSRTETGEDLKELLSQVSSLADRYFPKALKTCLKVKERFAEGKLPLLNYLKELQAFYPKDRGPAIFAKNYPAVSLLFAAQTARDPKLIEQLNALDSSVVFGEIQRLERDISEAYLGNERERQIFTYYQALSLLNRLNRIELTQPEYEAVKETLQKFETQKLADFIVLLTHRSLVLSKEWERHIKDAVRFYEIALRRDGVLSKALDRFSGASSGSQVPGSAGAAPAVLVYGGFHANSIKELLRAKGISYAVVTPAVTGIDKKHQEDYKELMSVGHYSFEVPFLAARANRPPSTFFVAATGGDQPVDQELRAIASSVEALGVHSATSLIEQRLSSLNSSQQPSVQRTTVIPFSRSEMRDAPGTRLELRWKSLLSGMPEAGARNFWTASLEEVRRDLARDDTDKIRIGRMMKEFAPKKIDPRKGIATSYGYSVTSFFDPGDAAQAEVARQLSEKQLEIVRNFGAGKVVLVPSGFDPVTGKVLNGQSSLHVTLEELSHGTAASISRGQLLRTAELLRPGLSKQGIIKGKLIGPFWHKSLAIVMIWVPETEEDPFLKTKRIVNQTLERPFQPRPFHLTLAYPKQGEFTGKEFRTEYARMENIPVTEIPVTISKIEVNGYADVAFIDVTREPNTVIDLSRSVTGSEDRLVRSEMRQDLGRSRSFFAISPISLWMRLLDLIAIKISMIPSLALIAIFIPLIKIANPEMSWLYQQKRIGFRGKPFTLLKLRTLDRKNEPIKLSGFPLGSFLRHSGLDELPQLWNILKREMAIYGPRPHQEWVIRASGFEKEYRDKVLARRVPGFLSLYASEIGPGLGPQHTDDFRRTIDLNHFEMDHWGPGIMAEIVYRTGRKILSQLSRPSANSQARSETRSPGEEGAKRNFFEASEEEWRAALESPAVGFDERQKQRIPELLSRIRQAIGSGELFRPARQDPFFQSLPGMNGRRVYAFRSQFDMTDRRALNPRHPLFNIEEWVRKGLLGSPANVDMLNAVKRNGLTGAMIHRLVREVLQPLDPDFSIGHLVPDTQDVVPAYNFIEVSDLIKERILIPHGIILAVPLQGSSQIIVAKITDRLPQRTLAGRQIVNYRVDVPSLDDFGEAQAFADHIVVPNQVYPDWARLARDFVQAKRRIDNRSWRLPDFSASPHAYLRFQNGFYMLGGREDVPGTVAAMEQLMLMEEVSHSDARDYWRRLTGRDYNPLKPQETEHFALSLLRENSMISRTLEEGTPEVRDILASAVLEIEGKLNAMRHSRNAVYGFLESIIPVIGQNDPHVMDSFSQQPPFYQLAYNSINLLLSEILFGQMTHDQGLWVRFLASYKDDIEALNALLKHAADQAYQKHFLSIEERDQKIREARSEVRSSLSAESEEEFKAWVVRDPGTNAEKGLAYQTPLLPQGPIDLNRAWRDFHAMVFEFPKLLERAARKKLPVVLVIPEKLDGFGPLADEAPWIEGARTALAWASAYFRFKELGHVDVRVLQLPGKEVSPEQIAEGVKKILSRTIRDEAPTPEAQMEARIFRLEEVLKTTRIPGPDLLLESRAIAEIAGAEKNDAAPEIIRPDLPPVPDGKKRIVVTGAAGFIGINLVKKLLAEGNQVIALDNLISANKEFSSFFRNEPNFYFKRWDVAEPFDIEGPVDQVLHLASLASPPDYYGHPREALRAGLQATRETMEMARRKRAQFLFTSTSEVYGDAEVHPQPETYAGNVSPFKKRSQYDQSKRGAETLIKLYAARYAREGLDLRIARIFNTYGPFMRIDDGRVITNFIGKMLKGEPLEIYGSDKITRSYGYVDDTVDGLLKLLRTDKLEPATPIQKRVFNIGNDSEFTLRELANLVNRLGKKYLHRTVPVQTVAVKDPSDPVRRRPNLTSARVFLGYAPTVPLREGLEKTFLYFLNSRSEVREGDAPAERKWGAPAPVVLTKIPGEFVLKGNVHFLLPPALHGRLRLELGDPKKPISRQSWVELISLSDPARRMKISIDEAAQQFVLTYAPKDQTDPLVTSLSMLNESGTSRQKYTLHLRPAFRAFYDDSFGIPRRPGTDRKRAIKAHLETLLAKDPGLKRQIYPNGRDGYVQFWGKLQLPGFYYQRYDRFEIVADRKTDPRFLALWEKEHPGNYVVYEYDDTHLESSGTGERIAVDKYDAATGLKKRKGYSLRLYENSGEFREFDAQVAGKIKQKDDSRGSDRNALTFQIGGTGFRFFPSAPVRIFTYAGERKSVSAVAKPVVKAIPVTIVRKQDQKKIEVRFDDPERSSAVIIDGITNDAGEPVRFRLDKYYNLAVILKLVDLGELPGVLISDLARSILASYPDLDPSVDSRRPSLLDYRYDAATNQIIPTQDFRDPFTFEIRSRSEMREMKLAGQRGEALSLENFEQYFEQAWQGNAHVRAHLVPESEPAGKYLLVLDPTIKEKDRVQENPNPKGLKPVRAVDPADFNFNKIKEGYLVPRGILATVASGGMEYYMVPPQDLTVPFHTLMISENVRPNILTAGDIRTALDIADRNPRMKFLHNTDWYTINHFHLHVTTMDLPVEKLLPEAEVRGTLGSVKVSKIKTWPLTHAIFEDADTGKLTEAAMKFVKVLQDGQIPHWTAILKGRVIVFYGEPNGPIAAVGAVLGKNHSMHVLESAGAVTVSPDKAGLTESQIDQGVRAASLNAGSDAELLAKAGFVARSEVRGTEGVGDGGILRIREIMEVRMRLRSEPKTEEKAAGSKRKPEQTEDHASFSSVAWVASRIPEIVSRFDLGIDTAAGGLVMDQYGNFGKNAGQAAWVVVPRSLPHQVLADIFQNRVSPGGILAVAYPVGEIPEISKIEAISAAKQAEAGIAAFIPGKLEDHDIHYVIIQKSSPARSETRLAPWDGWATAGDGVRIANETLPEDSRLRKVAEYLQENGLTGAMIVGRTTWGMFVQKPGDRPSANDPGFDVDIVLRDKKQFRDLAELARREGVDLDLAQARSRTVKLGGFRLDVVGWFEKDGRTIHDSNEVVRNLQDFPSFSFSRIGFIVKENGGVWRDSFHGIDDARNRVLRWMNDEKGPLTPATVLRAFSFLHSLPEKEGFLIGEASLDVLRKDIAQALSKENPDRSEVIKNIESVMEFVQKVASLNDRYAKASSEVQKKWIDLEIRSMVFREWTDQVWGRVKKDLWGGQWRRVFRDILGFARVVMGHDPVYGLMARDLGIAGLLGTDLAKIVIFYGLWKAPFIDQVSVDLREDKRGFKNITEDPWGFVGNLKTALHYANGEDLIRNFLELGGGWLFESMGINAETLINDWKAVRSKDPRYTEKISREIKDKFEKIGSLDVAPSLPAKKDDGRSEMRVGELIRTFAKKVQQYLTGEVLPGKPKIFNRVEDLIGWIHENVKDDDSILLMPYFTRTNISEVKKNRLLDYLDSDEFVGFSRGFLKKERKAAVSKVIRNGRPSYVVLISEAGLNNKAVMPRSGTSRLFHLLHGPNLEKNSEYIFRNGLFLIPGRAAFFFQPPPPASKSRNLVFELPNSLLVEIATDIPDHRVAAVEFSVAAMGARLSPDIREELLWRVRTEKGTSEADRAELLLLADEAGFLMRVSPESLKTSASTTHRPEGEVDGQKRSEMRASAGNLAIKDVKKLQKIKPDFFKFLETISPQEDDVFLAFFEDKLRAGFGNSVGMFNMHLEVMEKDRFLISSQFVAVLENAVSSLDLSVKLLDECLTKSGSRISAALNAAIESSIVQEGVSGLPYELRSVMENPEIRKALAADYRPQVQQTRDFLASTKKKIEEVLRNVPIPRDEGTSQQERSEVRERDAQQPVPAMAEARELSANEALMSQAVDLVDRHAFHPFPFAPMLKVGSLLAGKDGKKVSAAVNGMGQQHAERLAMLEALENVFHSARYAGTAFPDAQRIQSMIDYLRLSMKINERVQEKDLELFKELNERLGMPLSSMTLAVTMEPCENCDKFIAAAGIQQVLFGHSINAARGKPTRRESPLVFKEEINRQNRYALRFAVRFEKAYVKTLEFQRSLYVLYAAWRYGKDFAALSRAFSLPLLEAYLKEAQEQTDKTTLEELDRILGFVRAGKEMDRDTLRLYHTYLPQYPDAELVDIRDIPEFRTIQKNSPARAQHMIRVERFFRALTVGNFDYFIRRLPPGVRVEEQGRYRKSLGKLRSQFLKLSPQDQRELRLAIKFHDTGYAAKDSGVGHEIRGAEVVRKFSWPEAIAQADIERIATIVAHHSDAGWAYLGEMRMKKLLERPSRIAMLFIHSVVDAAAIKVFNDLPLYQLEARVNWLTDRGAMERVGQSFDQYRLEMLARLTNEAPLLDASQKAKLNGMISEAFGPEEALLRGQLRDNTDIALGTVWVTNQLVQTDGTYRNYAKFMKFLGQLSVIAGGEDITLQTDLVQADPAGRSQLFNGIREEVAPIIERVPDKMNLADVRDLLNGLPDGDVSYFNGIPIRREGNVITLRIREFIETKSRSEMRAVPQVQGGSTARPELRGDRADRMVKAIRKSVQPATVFVDAEDFPNLSLVQKHEYFYAALSGRGVRIVVYNERGQVRDQELGALLKLDRVTRTGRDLAGAQISFDRPGAPGIHLSKKILPSQELVQRLRKRVSFFKTQGQNGGTLAAALLWAWSGGEDARLREISRGRDGFWIVAESLVNALQRSYDATLAFAVAA